MQAAELLKHTEMFVSLLKFLFSKYLWVLPRLRRFFKKTAAQVVLADSLIDGM